MSRNAIQPEIAITKLTCTFKSLFDSCVLLSGGSTHDFLTFSTAVGIMFTPH